MVVFEYKNGASFAKTTAVELGGFERRQLVVNGTKATVELKPLEWYYDKVIKTGRNTSTSTVWGDAGKKESSEPFDRYHDMIHSFALYVKGEKENPYTLDYELDLYKLLLNACKEN